jgi:hypothetical protein
MARLGTRFGKEKAIKPFDDLRECVNRIFIAAKRIYYFQKREDLERETEKYQDKIRQYEADLEWGDDEKDRITSKVETAVREMEEMCQEIIGVK